MAVNTSNRIIINKFGYITGLSGTEQTVWNKGGQKTYSDTGWTLSLKGAAGATQTILCQGLRSINGVWTVFNEEITLDAANRVQSVYSDWVRCWRLQNIGTTSTTGTVNAHRNETDADTECQIAAGFNQSTFAGITIPDNYTGYLIKWGSSSDTAKNQTRRYARSEGGVFRLQSQLDVLAYYDRVYNEGSQPVYLPRTDIECRAILTTGSGGVAIADFDIVFNYNFTV